MKKASYISFSIIFITSLSIWGWYQVTPNYCDDFWAGYDWLNGRANWNNYGNFTTWLINNDSPRFFTFLFPIILGYIPKWLFDIVIGGTWFLSLWLILKIIGINLRRPLWTLALVWGVMLCLPWRIEPMTSVTYSCGYVLTMPLLFGSVWLFLNPSKAPCIILFLLGFITGWAQECIGWPLIGGIFCFYIFNGKNRNKSQLSLTGGLLAGFIFLTVLSYIPRYDGTNAIGGLLINFKTVIIGLFTLNYLALLSYIVLILGLCNQRLRNILWKQRHGMLPILLGSTIIATIMGVCLWLFGERTTWYAQLLGLILGAYLLNIYFPKPILKIKWVTISLGFIGVGLLIAHMTASIVFTYNQARNWHRIDQEYLMADTGNKFFNMPPIQGIPWLVYNKGSMALEGVREFDWTWRSKFYTDTVKPLPIPLTLKNIDSEELTKVSGNNPYFWCRKQIVAVPTEQLPAKVLITYNLGMRQEVPINYTTFTSQDGTNYFYVTLYTPEIMFPWKQVVQIDWLQ